MRLIVYTVIWLACLPPAALRAAGAGERAPAPPASVYRIVPEIDGPVLAVATLGASVPLFFERQLVHERCVCRRDDVNPVDRWVVGNDSAAAGLASHLLVGAALAAPVVWEQRDLGWTKPFLEDMVVYAEVLAINSALGNIARYGAGRARPDAYLKPQPVTRSSEFESFYSGHTANIVAGLSAASMTYGYRYGPHLWPWLLTAGAGAAEGGLRIAAGRHFLTDVLTGAAVGAAVGTIVPWLHHRARETTWGLHPEVSKDGALLVFAKRF